MGVLYFVGDFLEENLDRMWLRSYKQLLQRLAGNRVANYWFTYNALLRIYTKSKEEVEKLRRQQFPPSSGAAAS
jgi:hypothetical protein